MKNKIYLLSFISLIYFIFSYPLELSSECPECNYSEALLGITPENSAFLWYFTYYNIFDSVSVECQIGEFSYEHNGVKNKIIPRIDPIFSTSFWRILGQNQPGEDTILTQLVRTENFIYSQNSKINFYRALSVGISCGSVFPPIDTNAYYGDDRKFWVGNLGSILDTSEWVIQLMDAATNQVLWTIDSVGIGTNYDSPVAKLYGTNPKKMNHSRDLPNEFAGDTVYIRVSARRYGPTPYGMWLYATPSKFSLSSFYEYVENDCLIPFFKCNFDYQNFERYYFGKLVEYLDSLVESRGQPLKFSDLPSNTTWINRGLSDSLYSRYFDKIPLNDSTFYWVERSNELPRVGVLEKLEKNSVLKSKTNESLSLSYIYDAKSNSLILQSNKKYENCTIRAYNLLGEKIWEFSAFSIIEGLNRLNLPGKIIGGKFAIIHIIDLNGNLIASMKVILD